MGAPFGAGEAWKVPWRGEPPPQRGGNSSAKGNALVRPSPETLRALKGRNSTRNPILSRGLLIFPPTQQIEPLTRARSRAPAFGAASLRPLSVPAPAHRAGQSAGEPDAPHASRLTGPGKAYNMPDFLPEPVSGGSNLTCIILRPHPGLRVGATRHAPQHRAVRNAPEPRVWAVACCSPGGLQGA